MKFCCILLAIVLCLISVEGRNVHQQDTNSDLNQNMDMRHLKNKPERRMRNRRQSYFHNYNNYPDYGNSFQHIGAEDFLKEILFSVRDIATQMKQGSSNRYHPGYYDYRSEYNKCEDSLKELLTLYKELASHLKYSPPPPPPPQIIYVQYPVPATCNQKVDKRPNSVNITERNPPEDTNRIWMDIPKNTDTDDDGDGSRPVSFKPKQPKRPTIDPPPFEHGSTQAGVKTTTVPTIKKPGLCEAAILSCCGSKTEEEQENCFALYNCSKSYKTGLACNPDIIKMVLDDFSKIYGPINEF